MDIIVPFVHYTGFLSGNQEENPGFLCNFVKYFYTAVIFVCIVNRNRRPYPFLLLQESKAGARPSEKVRLRKPAAGLPGRGRLTKALFGPLLAEMLIQQYRPCRSDI